MREDLPLSDRMRHRQWLAWLASILVAFYRLARVCLCRLVADTSFSLQVELLRGECRSRALLDSLVAIDARAVLLLNPCFLCCRRDRLLLLVVLY